MLNKYQKCGKLTRNSLLRMDYMNRNSIVSLAMLYALWQTKRKDLLELITPFILFSVGNTTKVGNPIDVAAVCAYMESEFGYRSFQPAVITKVLSRHTSLLNQNSRFIEKKDGAYFLRKSLSDEVGAFSKKRTSCKVKVDAVTSALAAYLNEKQASKKTNFTQIDAERYLLTFFETQGSSILLSVDDLRQIGFKNNEINFYIGRFILEQKERRTALMDHLVELVQGYYVTTAIYLQAENPDVTQAMFKDVTFYLDTRLLLAFLGYKSAQENDSVQTMIRCLQKNGATLSCFDYNIEEVNNILEAYKMSRLYPSAKPSSITLEYFDEQGYSYTHVEAAQRTFVNRLEVGNIYPVSMYTAMAKHGIEGSLQGLIEEDKIQSIIQRIKPKYNLTTLNDDLAAISCVSRIRDGKKLPYIEKCRSVFVTSNTVLVAAVKEYHREDSVNIGFPLAITTEDLCVIAWLKDFEQNNTLPQMRLLENVLAALTPSAELIEAYFSHLDNLEHEGSYSESLVSLMRVDQFARQELMELTSGEKANLNVNVIHAIRQKIEADSRHDGYEKGRLEAYKTQMEAHKQKKNQVCKRAEQEVEQEFKRKEKNIICIINCGLIVLAIMLIAATVYTLLESVPRELMLIAIFTTAISLIQSIMTLCGKNTWPIRKAKERLNRSKEIEIEKRKQFYLSLLE